MSPVKVLKKAKLDEAVFGIEPNQAVLHQVVTAQLAARRAGTQSTKTRADVRGGGAKPWKQKGTGRARQGSIRSPQWRGGGVALGPKPRSYKQRTPKKMVKLALHSALSDRAAEGKVLVVDSWGFDGPSTKAAVVALADLGVESWLAPWAWVSLHVGGRYAIQSSALTATLNLELRFSAAGTRHRAVDPLATRWARYQDAVYPWPQ